MSWLIRSIDNLGPWIEAGDQLQAAAVEPPIWAIREFVPGPNNDLSVYEVEDEAEALLVAGAFGMSRAELAKGRIAFIAAPREAVEGAGIGIVQTGGVLHNHFADPRHRDLLIADHQTIATAAACFLGGELFTFEGKVVADAARTSMKADHFACGAIARVGFNGNMRAKNMLKFIGEEIATVHGVAA